MPSRQSARRTAYKLARSRRGELALWRHRGGETVDPWLHVAEPFALELAEDWARAAEAWTDLGCPYEAALALASAGQEPSLRRALAELRRLATEPAARIVMRRLRDRGARDVPLGPRRSTRQNPAELTSRELEVLTLDHELVENAAVGGATPLWQWIGDSATVFSY
jgi:hypothetical protein